MYLSAFRSELLAEANRPGAARPRESVKELFFCGILADGRGRAKHRDK
jgi:hypothetical protein